MSLLWLPIGLLPSIACGWLLLRLAEGSSPVLYKYERAVAGFVLGGIFTTFTIFLTEITGIGSFSFLSMLVTQLVLMMILGGLYWKNKEKLTANCQLITDNSSWKPWQKIATGILSVWILAKLVSGIILLSGPAYFDDTLSNWNIRAKAFYHHQELILELEPGKGTGIGSYPQSVPLLKTWLAHLNGEWHEALANSLHILWYLSALVLVYFAIRRLLNTKWALLGTYILASVPLYTMHGASAYGDCFLSVVIFLALSWVFFAAKSEGQERMSFIKLGSIAAALLVYTKSEAILLHLPPIIVLVAGLMLLGGMSTSQKRSTLLWYGACVSAVLLPWVGFKWMNNLGFGNAKDVSGMTLEWHEGVLQAIGLNTFWEGNWNLLPVLFLGLIIYKWRSAFRSHLAYLTGFVLVVIIGQLPIYMFTALHVEALNQTGYARGIIHLIPVIVVITTVLLHQVLDRDAR
ncbi:MAG: hypothetical protein HOG89_00550 [Candidatus Peribacter sp.]|jgi:hypothetical protein|nr:hypothetical protein [Candidatus Peribacter sp.]MBT4392985.1 hypothetical protein [Candidatus Peribacter sp.]MBT4601045.1 hypothetical protein [Candidatus Peribacter sp.]MBT5149593.1 hypothetical protein [Candidatus Peribacter sp.]MBT5637467.1 hypothetical protein [Candidatus Peribacter sp.]